MSEELGSGFVRIDIDDSGVTAELRKIEAEYKKTMDSIDRMEAEVTIEADTEKLDLAISNTRSRLARLEKEKTEVEVGSDTSEFDAEMKRLQAVLKKLDDRKIEIEAGVNVNEAEFKAAEKRVEALTKANMARQKVAAKYEEDLQKKLVKSRTALNAQRVAEQEKAMNDEIALRKSIERTRAALFDQRIREESKAESEAHRENERRLNDELAWQKQLMRSRQALFDQRIREEEQAEAAAYKEEQRRRKELAAIPQMRLQYAQLAAQLERLNKQRTLGKDKTQKAIVQLQIDDALAKMALLRERLQSIGEPAPSVDIHVRPGREFGLQMRNAINQGMRDSGVRGAGRNAGLLVGMEMSAGIVAAIRRTPTAIWKGAIGGSLAKVGRGLESLSNATVRLGPFTATIRQAAIGMTILAPLILDVVGALGSLVSVAASAAVGVGALSVGFLGGAIPAAIGMGLVIKDVAQEFTAAKKATKAYNDAVSKHGKSSDQAAKKMKELKNVMGSVSEVTAKQFVEGQKLGATWDKITKPAHASVWRMIGNSMQTAGAIMPMFGRNTNEAMSVAEKSTGRWMKALRGAEGQSAINSMMDNFTASMGPVLDGLGNIAGYLGKVGAIASAYLPGIAEHFKSWSQGLLDTADNSSALNGRINNVVESTRVFGALLMSTGRLLKAFFSGGVDAGQGFSRELTTTFNRWTTFLNSFEGRNMLGNFFTEAVNGARALYQTFGPLISSFVQWAASIAPFVRIFFQMAAGVSSAVAAFLDMTALRGPVSALVATLGALWAVGKISAATRAVIAFSKALLGLSAASGVAAAAGAAGAARGPGGFVGAAPIARGGTEAAKAAGKFSRLRGAVNGASMGMLGMRAATAGWVGLAVGAVATLGHLGTRTLQYEKDLAGATQAGAQWRDNLKQLPGLHQNVAQATLTQEQASLRLKQSLKSLAEVRRTTKDGSLEEKQALMDVRQARLDESAAIEQTITARKEESKAADRQVELARKRVDLARKAAEGDRNKKRGWQDWTGVGMLRNAVAGMKDRTKETRALSAAEAALQRSQELSTLASMNQARSLQQLGPMARGAAKSLHQVAQAGGKSLAKKISVKFTDSGDAQKVAANANRALSAGVKPQRVRFIVDGAKNAEQAIRSLNRAEVRAKIVKILEQGGKRAVAMLEQIAGRKLTAKEQRIAERGGKDVLGRLGQIDGKALRDKIFQVIAQGAREAIGTINNLAAMQIPDKTFSIRGIVSGGKGVSGISSKPPKAPQGRSGKTPGVARTTLIGEGLGEEYRINTRTGEGYRTSGPEFTKLDAADAIIPTEKRYRSRGKDILRAAARDLGIPMLAMGTFAKKKSPGVDTGQFDPSKTLPRAPTFAKKGKGAPKKPYSVKRGWSEYIENLHTQQGYWERETSIRESQVKEPEDIIVQTGENQVKDPITGEITKVPVYGPNEGPIKAYQAQLKHVIEALGMVMQIVQELVRAIPLAIAANKQERKYHKNSEDNLQDKIKNENSRQKKKKNPNYTHRDKLREQRDKHAEEREKLVEDQKKLEADQVEAGFDVREVSIARGKVQEEHDTILGDANKSAAERNLSESGTGTGGGGPSGGGSASTPGLSYGEQSALADTERANVLREFGSNFSNFATSSFAATLGGAAGRGAAGAFTQSGSFDTSNLSGARMASGAINSSSGPSMTSTTGGSSTGGSDAIPVGNTSNVNITNNFQQPPPDPHTFVKGMEFEAGTAF